MNTASVKREFTFTTLSRAVTWMLVVMIGWWRVSIGRQEGGVLSVSLLGDGVLVSSHCSFKLVKFYGLFFPSSFSQKV